MVVVDDDGFRRLPTEIAMYRAGLALLRGDVAGTLTHARRALDLAGADDHVGRGAAAAPAGTRALERPAISMRRTAGTPTAWRRWDGPDTART